MHHYNSHKFKTLNVNCMWHRIQLHFKGKFFHVLLTLFFMGFVSKGIIDVKGTHSEQETDRIEIPAQWHMPVLGGSSLVTKSFFIFSIYFKFFFWLTSNDLKQRCLSDGRNCSNGCFFFHSRERERESKSAN